MRKQELRLKIDLQYFKATGKSNGWEIWQELKAKDTSASEKAREFKTTEKTIYRWQEEETKNAVA